MSGRASNRATQAGPFLLGNGWQPGDEDYGYVSKANVRKRVHKWNENAAGEAPGWRCD
jgi:hypothetical protein